MTPHRPLYRALAFTLSGILFWNPLLSVAADLAVDKSAGGNTNIGQAGNGAPLVNIATPSAKGLSHNKFTDYNVGREGLILNNSTGPANASIAGGPIEGNPNLANGTATVILNEVTGTNRSQLKGYTEVAGDKAHVIVANPHGITCDGCGFINTPRATLTTGKPVLENGELKRYDVEQGQISFEGQDANVTNVDQFELITRSAQLNAKLHGKHITAVLGRNEVDAQTLAATPKADEKDKPRLALDSSALGGMYANSIRLIGTEAGVGVHLPGELAASAGDIRIDVNGKLTLASVAAAQELALKAQEIALKNAQAGKKARIEAAQTLTNTGTLAASQIELAALGFINTGSVLASGKLSIQTAWFDNRGGSLVAQDILNLVSSSLNNRDGEVLARNLTLNLAEDDWVNEGTLIAAHNLTLNLSSLENRGVLGAGNELILNASHLTNRAGALLFAGADMALYTQHLTNYGDVQAGGDLLIAANDTKKMAEAVSNRSGTIQSGGSLAIFSKLIENVRDVFETLTTKRASLSDPQRINSDDDNQLFHFTLEETVRTEVIEASAPSWLIAGAHLNLTGQQIKNEASVLAAAGDITIQADTFENAGFTLGDTTLTRLLQNAVIRNTSGSESDKLRRYTDAFNAAYNNFGPSEALDTEIKWFLDNIITPSCNYCDYEELGATFNIRLGSSNFLRIYSHRGQGQSLSSEARFTPIENAAWYQGLVQAGGKLVVTAKTEIRQGIEQPHFNAIGAGKTANGLPTPVSFNPQLAPETAHKLIDPLALTGLTTSALFKQAAPDHPWLIEVAPYVAAASNATLGSDYLMGLLGLPPDANQKRLGDALYEQWLIRQAILARLGQWLLTGFESEEAQYKALMDNAATEAQALQLTLGVALSAEQVASLQSDIVWLIEREIDGQKVLAPVLYLAQSPDRIAPNGAAMIGQNVQLSGQSLSNAGVIKAENLLALIDGKLENSGLMQSKETLALLAETIENARGGILAGEDIYLQAQGDFINEASVTTHEARLGSGQSAESPANPFYRTADKTQETFPDPRTRTDFIDAPARVEAGNNLVIQTGGNLTNRGGVIQAGGDARLEAGANLIIDTAETRQELESKGSDWEQRTQTITQHAAEVSAGGNLTLAAGQNLAVVGSHVQAQADVELLANGQIVIASVANEAHSRSYYESDKKTRDDIIDRVVQQSATITGNNVTLASGEDITLVSSRIDAKNDAVLLSNGKINLLAASDENYDYHYKKDKGFLSSKSQTDTVYDSRVVSSRIQAAGDIVLGSVSDITFVSGQLQAAGDVSLLSGGAINLLAGYDEHFEQHIKKSRSFGFTSYDASLTPITRTSAKSDSELKAVPNQIEAGGNITLQSVGDQRYQRAQLKAGEQLALISGGDIWFDATMDRHTSSKSSSYQDHHVQRSKDKGATDETLRQSELIAKGQPIIEAAGRIHVQIRELPPEQQAHIARAVGEVIDGPQAVGTVSGELNAEEITRAIDAMAGANPELAWLKQLNERGDVDFEKVKEVHKEWSKTFNGLTTLAAVVVVVVVTILTWGSASSAVAGAMGSTTSCTAAGVTAATTIGTATTAAAYAFGSSVFIQGSTTGRVDMNQAGKSAAVAFITAGILNAPVFEGGQSLNQLASLSNNPIPQSAGGFDGSVTQISAIIGKGAISAGVSNLIQGTDFKEGFVNSVVGDAAVLGANKIGSVWGGGKNPFMQTVAHGALGATAAWATNKDPWAGMIGGVSESIFGNLVGKNFSNTKWGNALYVGSSMLIGGTIADIFSHDPLTAAYAAQNAAVNNYLKHAEANEYQKLLERKRAGQCDDACQARMAELDKLDATRNADLRACEGNNSVRCVEIRQELFNAAAEYVRLQPIDPKGSASVFYLGPRDGGNDWDLNRLAYERMETFELALANAEGHSSLASLHGSWTAVKEMGESLWGLVEIVGGGLFGDQQALDKLKALPGAMWEAVSDPDNWPYLLGVMPPEKREQLALAYERGDAYEVERLLAEERLNIASNFFGIGATKNVSKLGNISKTANAADTAENILTIGGRFPINSQYAGKVHPSGIEFSPQGFPKFGPVSKAEVQLQGLTGNYAKDAAMANQAVGLDKTPPGYVWHHVEDGITMQLVPQNIHNAARHTGGSAVIRYGGFD